MLPKTIVTTLTAVPRSSGMLLVLAVVARRACRTSDANTALIARSSCSFGSLGEVAAGVGLDDRLELGDEVLQRGRVEVRVLLGPVRRLGRVQRVVEALAADLHDDPPEHLDEAAVGVPAEALVAGQRDRAPRRLAR